jgi:hypothetical protein
MRKIKEALRLHVDCGLSGRAIARSLSVGPATVFDYLARVRLANLTWPLTAARYERWPTGARCGSASTTMSS